MMKDEDLGWSKRKFSIRVAVVVRELDFAGTVEELHDGTDLAAHEAVRGHIREQGNNVEQLWRAMH